MGDEERIKELERQLEELLIAGEGLAETLVAYARDEITWLGAAPALAKWNDTIELNRIADALEGDGPILSEIPLSQADNLR